MIKLRQANAMTGYHKAEFIETDDLIEKIAAFNGKLSAQEVKNALAKGERVYTAFSYYVRIN